MDDSESLVDGDTLGNGSAINSVVHEEHFNVHFVGDKEVLETVWKEVSSLVISFVSNEHLFWLSTLKSSSCGAINTSNSSVRVGLNSLVLVSLESSGDSSDFLDDLSSVQWSGCHILYINKNI